MENLAEQKQNNSQRESTSVNVSTKESMKGNVNFAKVVVRDSSSGQVVSTKRIVLLADV